MKDELNLTTFPHSLCSYGFSALRSHTRLIEDSLSPKAFLHSFHPKDFPPVWVLWCKQNWSGHDLSIFNALVRLLSSMNSCIKLRKSCHNSPFYGFFALQEFFPPLDKIRVVCEGISTFTSLRAFLSSMNMSVLHEVWPVVWGLLTLSTPIWLLTNMDAEVLGGACPLEKDFPILIALTGFLY